MIRLVINLCIHEDKRGSLENFYKNTYLPLLQRQKGFVGASLGCLYHQDVLREIGAEIPLYNYQLNIEFDSEQARRAWVASPEHDPAWSQIVSMADKYSYAGYEIIEASYEPQREHG